MLTPLRIAYIVLAHQLPEQLVRLVERLDAPGHHFLLHVNRRSGDAVERPAREGLAGRENVVFLRRRRLYWGGFGHVRATLDGLAQLHARALPYDYAVLLTGQDYPIKPSAEIAARLRESGGRSFLEYAPVPTPGIADSAERLRHWHFRRVGREKGWHLRVPGRRRLPLGLVPHAGSAYWCLHRSAVEEVRGRLAREPSLLRFFRRVDVPDESLFQTILLNSPLRERMVNDHLRYIDWTRQPKPAVLGVADLPTLAASSALFARKFDVRVDAEVLDRIDEQLLPGGRQREGASIREKTMSDSAATAPARRTGRAVAEET